MKELYIITQSKEKIRVASSVFEKAGIKIKFHKTTHPEIQADSGIEIAKYAALQEAKELGRPVVREDHSLYIKALGEIPGPYTNYFERKIPVNKFIKFMDSFSDKRAYYELCASYADPKGNTREYSFRVPIIFTGKPKGNASIGWDEVTCFKGMKKTFAQYTEKERMTGRWIGRWDRNFVNIAKDIKEGKIKL